MDKKIDNKKQGKPEPSRIPGINPEACGQNPHWPGDGLLAPEDSDSTKLPDMPNHPTANGQ